MRASVLLCLLASVTPANACSIPVFRYALEHWQASRYQILLFHRGPLNEAERRRWDDIRHDASSANVQLVECDLTQPLDADHKAIWMREGKGASLPSLCLRYPDTKPDQSSAWFGPLTSETSKTLIRSPARQQLFSSLTRGHAGVILLLLSGNSETDETARQFLKREIPIAAQKLSLPKPSTEGPQIKSALPQLLEFPIIEVERSTKESVLVAQLLQSEDDLATVKTPIAFPVFGRGRALCSLYGKDLEKPGELQRALDFLCRACSCQVKELNPGIDLLIHGDWNTIFDDHPLRELGPMPRTVDSASKPSTQRESSADPKTSPPVEPRTTTTGPLIPEQRSAPPSGFVTGESRGGTVAPQSEPSVTKQVTIGAAILLVFLSLFWVYRSRQNTLEQPPT